VTRLTVVQPLGQPLDSSDTPHVFRMITVAIAAAAVAAAAIAAAALQSHRRMITLAAALQLQSATVLAVAKA
jgi:hypothetical protein